MAAPERVTAPQRAAPISDTETHSKNYKAEQLMTAQCVKVCDSWPMGMPNDSPKKTRLLPFDQQLPQTKRSTAGSSEDMKNPSARNLEKFKGEMF